MLSPTIQEARRILAKKNDKAINIGQLQQARIFYADFVACRDAPANSARRVEKKPR